MADPTLEGRGSGTRELIAKRPKVITDLLAVDDTGVVAGYIRKLEAAVLVSSPASNGSREWRDLLIAADSMLSAAGYGREVTKSEMIALSARIRKAYEQSASSPPSVATTKREHIRRQCLCGHADSSHGLVNGSGACRFCQCLGFRREETPPSVATGAGTDVDEIEGLRYRLAGTERAYERLRNLLDCYGFVREWAYNQTKARLQRMYRAWSRPGADESLVPFTHEEWASPAPLPDAPTREDIDGAILNQKAVPLPDAAPSPTHTADGREIVETLHLPARTVRIVKATPDPYVSEEDAAPSPWREKCPICKPYHTCAAWHRFCRAALNPLALWDVAERFDPSGRLARYIEAVTGMDTAGARAALDAENASSSPAAKEQP